MPRVAVLKFPGTNCDGDVAWAARRSAGLDARVVWHAELRAGEWDAIVIPGGFSYGDWLRAGAIAAQTRAMEIVAEEAEQGVPVLGICNGFQILVEAGLLPGAFLGNTSGRFVCRWVRLVVERPRGPWLLLLRDGQVLSMPVAHAEGRYFIDGEGLRGLERRPLLRYADGYNPNGSIGDIAGVATEDGSVLGLMPHPERAAEPELIPRGFSPDGQLIFRSLAEALRRGW
ncbi:MAG: phosphoribosylformylglycinamidine synthase I [Thermoprotei archaeon]|nr:MAG: phosphoribosylformylglycinamidine synthase I [Thermoprotei archaeon]